MRNVDTELKAPTVRSVALLAISALTLTVGLYGCGDDNNRKPTQAEVKAADVNRQASLDKMDLPPDQKARMKAQMGGPAVASPADAARSGSAPSGKRTN